MLVNRRLPPLLLLLAGCGGDPQAPGAQDAGAAAAAPTVPAPRAAHIQRRLIPPRAVIGSDPDPRPSVLVFSAREPPARLLDWFRGTANGADFVLESEMQEGAEHVFSGRVRETGEAFTVRIAPGNTGGTTGMVMVTPR